MSSAAAERDAGPVAARQMPQDLYRLLLLRKNGSELRVAGERPPYTLPCVEIPAWERVAENLTAAVRKRYGIPAICLFMPQLSAATTDGEGPLYQVIETREASVTGSEETGWLPVPPPPPPPPADAQDFSPLTNIYPHLPTFQ